MKGTPGSAWALLAGRAARTAGSPMPAGSAPAGTRAAAGSCSTPWSRCASRCRPSPRLPAAPGAVRAGSGPSWWPRCASPTGPPTACCAMPATRACARTARPPASCARRRSRQQPCPGGRADAGGPLDRRRGADQPAPTGWSSTEPPADQGRRRALLRGRGRARSCRRSPAAP